MLQNYQEAIECYSTAAHQDPLDPTAHWYAAQCYFSSGNLKMARVALESAITQAKKEEKHLKLLTQLELVHQIWTPTQEGLS
jgi:tetratricopeptide (TPR) repeat protein